MHERHTRYNFVEDEGIVRPRYLGEMSTQEPDENGDLHTHDFVNSSLPFLARCMWDVGPCSVAERGDGCMDTARHKALAALQFNNVMVYVDVSRDEANHLGRDCRVVAMNPLLRALFAATMPEVSEVRETSHNVALHVLLRHELLAARDVPLSLKLPKDDRVRGLAEAALNDPGKVCSVEAWLADTPASRKTIERVFNAETGMPPLVVATRANFARCVIAGCW